MSKQSSAEHLRIHYKHDGGNQPIDWPTRLAELSAMFPDAVVSFSPELLANLLIKENTDPQVTIEQFIAEDDLRQALAITWRELNIDSESRVVKTQVSRLLGLVKFDLAMDCDLPEWENAIPYGEHFLPPQIATEIVRASSIDDLEKRMRGLYPPGYRPAMAADRNGTPHYTKEISELSLAALKRAILMITNPERGLEADLNSE